MTNLDQFSSVFNSAVKTTYKHSLVALTRVLVITDLESAKSPFVEQLKKFLSVLETDGRKPEYDVVTADRFSSVQELLDLVESHQADLIVTYRNLHSNAWQWPYSLGDSIDVLTQISSVPVLLLPHPESKQGYAATMQNTDVVMAITDHMTGDDQLVDYASAFTADGGTLWLSHLEDEATFERYTEAISKIPSIDTETAAEDLKAQLLKEPAEYAKTCAVELLKTDEKIKVEVLVLMGHALKDYLRLILEHKVDLLVLNTKDDEQMAMHGLAYPLAVQLRQTPLLML